MDYPSATFVADRTTARPATDQNQRTSVAAGSPIHPVVYRLNPTAARIPVPGALPSLEIASAVDGASCGRNVITSPQGIHGNGQSCNGVGEAGRLSD